MNERIVLALAATFLLGLLGCKDVKKKRQTDTVSIEHELGETDVPINPKKIFVYDMGTLETLHELNVPVAGIPKDFVPPHLIQYKKDATVEDVGSILKPNLEKVSALHPDLVIISSLHADDYDQLSYIVPTVSLGVESDDYTGSIVDNLNRIGKIFNIKNKTDKQIMAIQQQTKDAAQVIGSRPQRVMVLMYNAGVFSSFGPKSRYSFVFTDLKAKPADNNLASDIHGAIVSSEYIAHVNPDILYIIDRNAILEEYRTNPHEVENALVRKTNAFKTKNIYYLDPYIWYLSGGGSYSLKHMVNDVLQAYR